MLFVEKKSKKKNSRNKIVKFFIGNSNIAFFDSPGFISRNDIELIMKEIVIKIKRFIIKYKSMDFMWLILIS